MISLWKFFDIFLHNKYKNRQARDVLELHDEQYLRASIDRRRCSSFCSLNYLRQYCCLKNNEYKARNRLGQRISYMELYKYSYIVDKHEMEVAELKE